MPRDAVSRTVNVERNGGHKWVNVTTFPIELAPYAISFDTKSIGKA